MGVGAAKRWKSVKWNVVERIVWAWIFTMPVTAALAYGLYRLVMVGLYSGPSPQILCAHIAHRPSA